MQHNKSSRDALLTRAQQEDATPDELLDAEQLKRKRDREKKRKQRVGEKQEKAASTSETEKEWWEGNRATLAPETLAAMVEQEAYIRDVLYGMQIVVGMPKSDPELIQIVVDLVKEHGTAHLGRITRDPDIPADWSTGVFHGNAKYWQDTKLLSKLIAEGPATERYVKFGLLSGLPDWRVEEFLTGKAGWTWQQAADVVGYVTSRNTVSYR
jgi:hypothetical protein